MAGHGGRNPVDVVGHDDAIAAPRPFPMEKQQRVAYRDSEFGIAEVALAVAPIQFDEETADLLAFEGISNTLGNCQITIIPLGVGKSRGYSVDGQPSISLRAPNVGDLAWDGIYQTEGNKVQCAFLAPMWQVSTVNVERRMLIKARENIVFDRARCHAVSSWSHLETGPTLARM